VVNYLLGWFALDLISTMPTSILEDAVKAAGAEVASGGANKLVRILRLPRLYRLARLMRLVKVLKLLRYNTNVIAMMNALNLSD